MITFKREDLGLYVALSLVGGGLGLLAGSLVASRLKKRKFISAFETVGMVDEVVETDDGLIIRGQLSERFKVDRNFKLRKFDFHHDGVAGDMITAVTVDEVETGEKFKEPDEEFTDEERAWIEEYEPNVVQIGMYKSGYFTLDQMIEMMDEGQKLREETEPYSYNSMYKSTRVDDKPDLSELVPDEYILEEVKELLIDERFLILNEGRDEIEVDKEFEYDPDGPVWISLSARNNLVSDRTIARYIPKDVWPEIEEVLLEREDIIVQDFSTGVKYRFYINQEDDSGIDLDIGDDVS